MYFICFLTFLMHRKYSMKGSIGLHDDTLLTSSFRWKSAYFPRCPLSAYFASAYTFSGKITLLRSRKKSSCPILHFLLYLMHSISIIHFPPQVLFMLSCSKINVICTFSSISSYRFLEQAGSWNGFGAIILLLLSSVRRGLIISTLGFNT